VLVVVTFVLTAHQTFILMHTVLALL